MSSGSDVEQGDEREAPAGQGFPCGQCGADLVFAAGTDQLACPYCGFVNTIEADDDVVVEELDYRATFARLEAEADAETVEVSTVKCDGCGSQTARPPDLDAFDCAFCGKSIVAPAIASRVVRPRSLLPFHVTAETAHRAFRTWIGKRWFAPNDLKQFARSGGRLEGVYVPYWTYDSATTTTYTGQRGEHYWTTQPYTTTVNGKRVTRTRQVRRTRWYPAAGTVHNHFDDLLVLASRSLPERDARKLEPWDLEALVPFDEAFLAGFRAEKYQVDLAAGFGVACELMETPIRASIRQDIGGDQQRIATMSTAYDRITFKHVLLPVWISAYTYRDRVYRILVNARTGEIQGERPYSVWKIVGAVIGALAVAGVIAAIVAVTR